jgi:hypothetical protein
MGFFKCPAKGGVILAPATPWDAAGMHLKEYMDEDPWPLDLEYREMEYKRIKRKRRMRRG